MRRERTWITAHSGADSTTPNSLTFVRHALASVADALEVDVRQGADGALVLSHDAPDPDARPPVLLKEVFDLLSPSDKKINCDLKESGLEQVTLDLAAASGIADRLILTGTVSEAYLRSSAPSDRPMIALNIEEYVPAIYDRCLRNPAEVDVCAREMTDICRSLAISCVNANYRLATDSFVRILHEAGILLSVWTVDEAAEIERFLALGVRNITTRNLAFFRKI